MTKKIESRRGSPLRSIWIGALVLVGLLLVAGIFIPRRTAKAKAVVTVDVFPTESGWGYRILRNGEPFIEQAVLPGVPGRRPFPSPEAARRVGTFAARRWERTGRLPTLTEADLQRLGIR